MKKVVYAEGKFLREIDVCDFYCVRKMIQREKTTKCHIKGQLSITVGVKAIKLLPECYQSSTGEVLHNREWLSVEDFSHHTLVNGTSSTEMSLPQFEITEPENEQSKQSSCLCSCFGRLFSKNKSSHLEAKHKDNEKSNSQSKSGKYAETIEGWRPREQLSSVKHSNSDRFINLENLFRQKTSDFYELLCEPSSSAHTLLLKYFEQHRGLLVLDTRADQEGVVIINICTTAEKVSSLGQDYNSGKLTSDLQREIISQETLKPIKVLGLKIMVSCEQDELDQVEQELS
ncbi:hypothetical protein LSH36_1106g00015 [Paralvinella palmiformis]|uniref:Uncharacterized protein n=1 Tax=Paralvinella palmiformis TaxID=53620 RepID=A0AAD9MSH9_9ANNE|nr:hypothetical protein LSH36_1106g00015 [Paralvinella palmiformis]